MSFCGNIVELVKKDKILKDKSEFVKYVSKNGDSEIEVYIETEILPELEEKSLLLIDVAIGMVNDKKVGMFFIKKGQDVYG